MDKLVRWSSIFYLKLCQTCQLKYPQFCSKHRSHRTLKNRIIKSTFYDIMFPFQARFSNPLSMASTHSSIPRSFGIPLCNSEINSNNNRGDNSSNNSSQVSPPNNNNSLHNNPNNSGSSRSRHSTSKTFETIRHSSRTFSSPGSHR